MIDRDAFIELLDAVIENDEAVNAVEEAYKITLSDQARKYDIVISAFEETLRKLLQMTAIGLHFLAMPRVSCHGIIKELETSRISSSCNMTSPIMNQFFNI